MKKIFAIIAFTLLAQASFAGENLKFGVRFNEGISMFSGKDLDGILKEAGTNSGVTFEMLIKMNEQLAIHPAIGINFDLYEATVKYEESDGYFHYYGSVDENLILFNLQLPILARYNFTPGFFAEAGLQADFNLISSYGIDGDYESIKKDVSACDFGVAVGAGYTFWFGLGIDGRFIFGLTDTFDRPEASQTRFQIGLSWMK